MGRHGGVVASWLVYSPLDQAGQVLALIRTMCCVLGQVPLSIQVYKWVQANLIFGPNLTMD